MKWWVWSCAFVFLSYCDTTSAFDVDWLGNLRRFFLVHFARRASRREAKDAIHVLGSRTPCCGTEEWKRRMDAASQRQIDLRSRLRFQIVWGSQVHQFILLLKWRFWKDGFYFHADLFNRDGSNESVRSAVASSIAMLVRCAVVFPNRCLVL